MRANPKDIGAGVLFITIGLLFGIGAWSGLRMGTARSMGPGYFPTVLSCVLVVLGLVITAGAFGRHATGNWRVSWRGVLLVTFAIAFFAFTVRGLGMAPALGGATLLAALSTPRNSFVTAVVLAVVLTSFCVAVFVLALGLPYAVIGPWLIER